MYVRPKDRELYKSIDTSQCKTCEYKGYFESEICCDYMLLTGKPRGCSGNPCEKYVEREKARRLVHISIDEYCQLSPKDAEEKKKRKTALNKLKEGK